MTSQYKARHAAMIATALELLSQAADPTLPRTHRAIRQRLQDEYGASRTAAHRIVRRALDIRAGRPIPQWGGKRPDAGRPRKVDAE